ncbi:hypothetical protein IMCC3317_27590 [Kordia antarctica]|uniref:Uncharacterized protein n=1 Tax=Kordia antarctica TaxID=1218801 RepID=A0A7L4ZLF2_9FLAO|nr:hypothetical protein [Kordia antarctica]QHI37380.1 hypothetical protein IMCC3317_27590 [Kordia antarctica]
MKKILFTIFQILITIVFIGKISNWFLNYSDETNQILNVAMFTLIGIAYMYTGFIWDKKLIKTILIVCGLYLIVANFISDFYLKSIIGIVCILVPMLIIRFSHKEVDEEQLEEEIDKKHNWNLVDLTWSDIFSHKKKH